MTDGTFTVHHSEPRYARVPGRDGTMLPDEESFDGWARVDLRCDGCGEDFTARRGRRGQPRTFAPNTGNASINVTCPKGKHQGTVPPEVMDRFRSPAR